MHRPSLSLVMLAWLLLSPLMLGCSDDAPATTPDVEAPAADDSVLPDAAWCSGPVSFAWDPLAEDLPWNAFPDDFYTRPGEGPTGVSLRLDDTTAPWRAAFPAAFQLVFEQLNQLDGFGTTAGIFLRFTGEVGALPDGALRLIELPDGSPVPFEEKRTDEDHTILLLPMIPLKPATRHAVVLVGGPTAECIAPGAALRPILEGQADDERLEPLVARYEEALAAAGVAAEEISAATVFTTQSTVDESITIAAGIAAADPPAWVEGEASTETLVSFVVSERSFHAVDYRQDHVVTTAPVSEYELAVRSWMPVDGQGPWPTILFGHGLSGDRKQAELLAEAATELGFVIVAIDAAEHGEHPAGTAPSSLEQVMAFFGIDVATLSLNPLRLRDNWRQSTYDKLQLLRLLQSDGDLNGDGTADVDPSSMIYFGVSLGGIMGPELLSLTDAFGAAILAVGGGRVGTIIQEASQFSIVIDLMKPEGTTDGDIARFFPVLQTLLDRGDSASYAPHVLRDRLPDAGAAPHLLTINVIDDDTVPPGTNRMLNRALGIPHVPPVIEEVGIIPIESEAPVTANVNEGSLTAGHFQYDRITEKEGQSPKAATHSNVAKSREGILQAVTFLQTWLETGTPTIVDPYAELETPPLE